MGKSALLQLVIRPITLNHHMIHHVLLTFSAPCETGDIHTSALHLYNGCGRISGDPKGTQVHPSGVVAARYKPTLEELLIEYQQVYESLKKQRKEESMKAR